MTSRTPSDIFKHWNQLIEAGIVSMAPASWSYRFTINGTEGGEWLLSSSSESGEKSALEAKGGCEILLQAEDFMCIAEGSLSPQDAFLNGKLEIYRGYYYCKNCKSSVAPLDNR